MTTTAEGRRRRAGERSARLYRSLLVAYPRSFRDEFGDDLVQAFGDLHRFAEDGRRVWWRAARDLSSSAARERWTQLASRPPGLGYLLVALAAAVGLVVAGRGPAVGALVLVPAILLTLVGLPLYGLTRFRRAWLIRRTTGGPIAGRIGLGAACFAPAGAFVAYFGEDAGYWIFVTGALTLIGGCLVGLAWAVNAIVARRRERGRARWRTPLLVLVPALLVLGLIIGGAYNSYRNSLGPPGDHSVENASADTRALWDAAGAADLDEVTRLTETTCADPWVKFPVNGGRHNAKGYAETLGMEGSPAGRILGEIADHLGDYMDVWYDTCGEGAD